jgi:FdrA protein
MTVKSIVKSSEYHDSVRLMLVARDLSRMPGVIDASVVMATEANKALLKAAGLLTPEAAAAAPNDLVIAVSASPEVVEAAIAEAGRLLEQKSASKTEGAAFRPKTLRSALKSAPAANLAVISVAGRYAADEAWQALNAGLHVLLFSDNVSLEDEIALKRYAVEHGLLLMGPGAGTAIINGAALGFANVIPPGPVGIVSAAGTGLQEVSTLLAKEGAGITQGIGTGGRDLKEEVGGLMMLAGLQALQDDPATQVIVLVSKPPAPVVTRHILEVVGRGSKPTVVCFLGSDEGTVRDIPNAVPARTLEEAAWLAARLARGEWVRGCEAVLEHRNLELKLLAGPARQSLTPGQKYIRGLFSGGTLCYEAQVIWRDLLPEAVWSNAPLDKAYTLSESTHSQGHTAIDLGEEEFTVGRPHPMIDNDLRIRRLYQEAQDPETAVILLDVVLGYGAHPDPASELGPAVIKARTLAKAAGRELLVVASVTGTDADPQGLRRQVAALQNAGVAVCDSNATSARLAAYIVCP